MQTKNDHFQENSFKVVFSNFIQRHRGILSISLILVLVGIIGAAVWYELDKNWKMDITVKFETLDDKINKAKSETDASKKETLNKEIQNLYKEFESVSNGFPKLRVYTIRAQEAYDKKDLDGALDFFKKAIDVLPNHFMVPSILLNCATISEMKNDLPGALSFLDKILNEFKTSSILPEAIFTKARIFEQTGKIPEAKELYNQLQDKFPGKTWTNAARNRIILLGN